MNSLGQTVCPVASNMSRACLRRTQKDIQNLVHRVKDFCNIPSELAMNIITYAKCLENSGSGCIDSNIFNAQLVRFFDISHPVMVQRMYHACKLIGLGDVDRCKIHRELTTEEYCKMIGLFIGNEDEKKVEFVFNVYDVHCAGFLDKMSCKVLIKEGVCLSFVDDVSDMDQITGDLYEMIINVYDLNVYNKHGEIEGWPSSLAIFHSL